MLYPELKKENIKKIAILKLPFGQPATWNLVAPMQILVAQGNRPCSVLGYFTVT